LVRSGSSAFRPRARVLATLGHELISSDRVALVELVKNSYDADAKHVAITFGVPLISGKGSIEVRDDGAGMSLDDVLTKWLEPANAHRQRQPESIEFHRPLLGEKGIGRFAAARLAEHLELVTRQPKSTTEVVVRVDWTAFENDVKYLDELRVDWLLRAPTTFSGKQLQPKYGTRLLLTNLRSDWSEDDLRRLRTDLSRLIFAAGTTDAPNFGIELVLPKGLEEFAGQVNPPTELQDPRYQIVGEVSDKGRGKFWITLDRHREKVEIDLAAVLGHAPRCGRFGIDIRVWDRDVASLSELAERYASSIKNVRDALDQSAGVSVYRDRFRVLPYGEAGDDWLQLDRRRIQNPTMRLSNNQVVGFVLISKESNPSLKDQTNREGLIQGPAFEDLRTSVVAILAELETRRFNSKPRRTTPRARGLFDEINIDDVRDAITSRHPRDKALLEVVSHREQRLREAVEGVQQILGRYRRLATLGQLIDAVVHEFRHPLSTIRNEMELLSDDLRTRGSLTKKTQGRLAFVTDQIIRLADIVRRVEPFGGRRRGRPAETDLEDAISGAFALMRSELESKSITTRLPNTHTKVSADPTEIQEVILNLLTNSIYWLGRVDKNKRQIEVATGRSDGSATIVFSDSGPGVPVELRDRIFEPYFSSKPEGVGLGLAIAGEIVSDYYDGELALVDSGPLPGATFRITLKKRV
jgi:signal transduction histidine kinase